jgi:cytochrome oxidase assembly protein ShyY1
VSAAPNRPHPLAPRFWPVHLLAIVLVAAATMLGMWQLDAWQAKRNAEARDLTRETPVALDSVLGADAPFNGEYVGQPVTLDGTWLPGSTFLVSGRERADVSGYWVVTPVTVKASGSAVLVVRGWTESADVEVAAPSGGVTIEGWLQPAEGTGEVDEDPDDDVLPQLRVADALHFVDGDLYGGYVIAADTDPGLEKAELDQLPPAPRFSAIRNFFYAIEWWFFGGFVVFMWWRWLRDDVLASDEDEVAAEA